MLGAACNAPRNNPFDPQNPRSPYVTLAGQVHSESLPRTALAGVAIAWRNDSRVTQTDAGGYFHLADLLPENGWLYVEKDGYKGDSTLVLWGREKQLDLDILLNAKPRLQNLQLATEILHQYPTNQESRLVVKARIFDQDNDIDSVFVINENIGLRKALAYDVGDKSWIQVIKLFDLKSDDLEELIGQTFLMQVKDNKGDEIEVGRDGIKRVIKEEIEFESPAGGQSVPAMPTFRWRRLQPGFPFTFMLEIFTFEGSVFQKSGLPEESLDYTLETPLAPGEYFWVVWCVDEFQNRSRSKPASFIVN